MPSSRDLPDGGSNPGLLCLFDDSHSVRCEVLSHCFNLHFSEIISISVPFFCILSLTFVVCSHFDDYNSDRCEVTSH